MNANEELRIVSFSVRLSYSHHLRRPDSSQKLQDHRWSDEAEVKETLSALARTLGFGLAKRLVYHLQEWS